MGEVIKSCCYCCCTCYQSGICCASLCCVVLPIIGLLSILAGIVVAIMLAFSVQHNSTTEYTISRLVTVLGNLSLTTTMTATTTINSTNSNGTIVGLLGGD